MEVAVTDGGGPTVPMVNEPSNWSLGGRGLGIVARLSLRWGVCVADGHWASDPDDDDGVRNGRVPGTNEDGGHVHYGSPDGADGVHGDCLGYGGAGDTTVWAEVPVRYGSPASLVIASSREA